MTYLTYLTSMDESFLEAACDLDGMLDCGGRMITISISDSAQSRVFT